MTLLTTLLADQQTNIGLIPLVILIVLAVLAVFLLVARRWR